MSYNGPLLILLVPLSIKYFSHQQNFIVFHLYPDCLSTEPSEHANCPGSTQQPDPVVEGGQSSGAEDWTFMGWSRTR